VTPPGPNFKRRAGLSATAGLSCVNWKVNGLPQCLDAVGPATITASGPLTTIDVKNINLQIKKNKHKNMFFTFIKTVKSYKPTYRRFCANFGE